jgi:hypothetical protein
LIGGEILDAGFWILDIYKELLLLYPGSSIRHPGSVRQRCHKRFKTTE